MLIISLILPKVNKNNYLVQYFEYIVVEKLPKEIYNTR